MPSETRKGRLAAWAGAGAVLLAAAGVVALAGGSDRRPRELPGLDAPSAITLAAADEPGVPLVVRGRVFAPDGETPVAGVVIYLYQTGADGRYAPFGVGTPRLRGWVRTDAEGRYEVRTIRPGSYPGRSTPAHVHAALWGAGFPPQWGGDVLFADDPLLGAEERRASEGAGRFAHVCTPERGAAGELLCTRNYRLKSEGDDVADEVGHAFQAPRER